MASNQTQCEMCCNENAVGYCKTCGNIGETCVEIHKTGRAFKIHILNMYEKDGCNPRRILCDIIQKMCTHHPTERTALFCKTHETLICGRCLQSDHVSSCGGYDVDMCKDATHINCDPANDTTEALYIIRDIAGDIKQMKEEIDQRIETNNTNVVKGNKELDSLEIKLKGKVKDSKRGFSQETCTTNDFNLDANSMGSASQEMQMTRNELIEASIKAKLDAEKAEITRKELCDKLKHVKHDLETSEKTRQELCYELKLVKQDLENSEKTRKQQCDELKQELDTSEKRRNTFEKELLQAKLVIEQSEKTRQKLCDELERVKKDLDNSEKERAVVTAQLSPLKENIKWTQPTGTVDVEISQGIFGYINLIFTFPDGIQTTHHPSPGKPYKGGRFTGHLCTDSDGELLCRMLKAAFKKGLMFNFGKEGKVVLDGVTLYNRPLYDFKEWKTYDAYTQTLKAQLSAKGITEANIDQTEDLFETLNVNGSCLFDAAPSS
ncbi:E3 ubiquitin-protein ligase DTX3L-like isoform X2 [Mya arenaria]|uniref:E3 ubiquitin-protein ligase DTX3L-like isoform X2 n=1 Tax=Mya arenaria TaxID=6604 RepID=UPI0022E06DA2|nr:E3 ubiquitin-protein ligase DTX3L-like isoform X2 [Mya arenaria]